MNMPEPQELTEIAARLEQADYSEQSRIRAELRSRLQQRARRELPNKVKRVQLIQRFSTGAQWAAGFSLLICVALSLSWVLGRFTPFPGNANPTAYPASTETTPALAAYFGQPPAAALDLNAQSQNGSIGTYTWIKTGGTSVSADAVALSTPVDALLTTSPLHGVLHFSIPVAPESVTMAVIAVSATDEKTEYRTEAQRFWKAVSGMGMGLPANPTPDFDLNDQADGLYMLQVSAHWKDLGSVNYGFLVQVGPPGATPIPPLDILQPTTEPAATLQAPVKIPVLSPAVQVGKGAAKSIALSADGQWLAVNTPRGIYQYHTGSFEQAWFYPINTGVSGLQFSPDGQRLALSDGSGSITILESASNSLVSKIQVRDSASLAWSPDSTRLVSGASCETVTVWNASSGEELKELQGNQCSEGYSGVTVAWSGDGRSIYAAGPGPNLQAWDANSYQPLADFKAEGPQTSMAVSIFASPKGNLLALMDMMGSAAVPILDGSTGKQVSVLQSPTNIPELSAAWSPDGRYIAVASGASTSMIQVWEAASGQVVNTLNGFYAYEGWTWMPDGQSLIGLFIQEDSSIGIVDIKTGSVQRSLAGHAPGAAYLAWNGDGLVTSDAMKMTWWDPDSGQALRQSPHDETSQKLFAAGSISPDGSRQVANDAVQEIQSGATLVVLEGSGDQSRRPIAAWSADGQRLASSDDLGLLDPVIWDPQTGKVLLTLKLNAGEFRPYLQVLAWSPDGQWLVGGGGIQDTATGETNGMLVVWDARSGQQVQLLTTGMLQGRVMSLTWSPDGQRLAAVPGSTIIVWDVQAYQPIALLQGHAVTPGALAWSPDSRQLASIANDCTLMIWNVQP